MKLGSYSTADIQFLLTRLDDFADETTTSEREKNIQSGQHYFEMLPIEEPPSSQYMTLFYRSLEKHKYKLAVAIAVCCERMVERRGTDLVLASLVRGGTPLGILMKSYLAFRYQLDVPHYGISILRGRGIDEVALSHIVKQHSDTAIMFVDGWTGKGAIKLELDEAVKQYNLEHGTAIRSDLAVVADPGYCTDLFGTREDFLIPSACLNATVSGLLSRTFWNDEIMEKHQFHGVKFYEKFAAIDVSNLFIDTVSAMFPLIEKQVDQTLEKGEDIAASWQGLQEIKRIQAEFQLPSINLVKPGVGETTRILLRRIPWKILVKDIHHEDLQHILLLAKEKNVPVETYPLMSYRCCGLIQSLVQS